MVADTGKKAKVCEENTEQIDGDLLLSVEKLQEIQDELDRINGEVNDKILEIDRKYNEVRKPVYDKRNDIIKSIPDFWLTAFLSHPALCDVLSEEDQKIFKYLNSLEVEEFKDVKSGYSISFNFNPNSFFEESKLTKSFMFLDEGTIKVTATKINWKNGEGLPNGVVHDKKGNKRPHPADESFFSWFSEIEQKDDSGEISDEIADVIREELWPNPLAYFNNENGSDGSEGGEDDDEEEDGDDDDGGDEEEDS